MTTAVPERLRWAVDGLDLRPGLRALELGCGRGVAVGLVLERLGTGTLVAVDRSAVAVAATRERAAAAVADGRLVVRQAALETLDPADGRFDRVFAVNVNAFWLAGADERLAGVARLLEPGGALHLVYEPPSAEQADRVEDQVGTAAASGGLALRTERVTAARGDVLLRLAVEVG